MKIQTTKNVFFFYSCICLCDFNNNKLETYHAGEEEEEGKEKERVRESKEGSSVGFNGATEAITSVTTSPRAREK